MSTTSNAVRHPVRQQRQAAQKIVQRLQREQRSLAIILRGARRLAAQV